MGKRILNKEEIFRIIRKNLMAEDIHSHISDIQFLYINWKMMNLNKKEQYYWIDFSKGEGRIMSYHNGYNHKYITVSQIKKYIAQEFDASSSVTLDLTVPNNDLLKLCDSKEEETKLIELVATVYFEEPKIEAEQLRSLIEIALLIKDKEWFNELSKKYNDTYKGVKR